MAWNISVWHEEHDDRARLIVEAGPEVPDDIVSALAGAYWLEEVQYSGDGWEEADLEPGPMQG